MRHGAGVDGILSRLTTIYISFTEGTLPVLFFVLISLIQFFVKNIGAVKHLCPLLSFQVHN